MPHRFAMKWLLAPMALIGAFVTVGLLGCYCLTLPSKPILPLFAPATFDVVNYGLWRCGIISEAPASHLEYLIRTTVRTESGWDAASAVL